MRLKMPLAALGLAITSFAAAPAMAAKKPQMSGLELQQIQSKDFEATKKTSFAATMSVLQDAGYRIGSADYDTGLITALASTKSKMTWLPFVGFGRSKKTPVVSAYIEERGALNSRIRLNFVMGKLSSNNLAFGGVTDEEPIYDSAVYQDAFEKISQAIFVRLSLDAPPQAASESASSQPTASAAAAPAGAAGDATPQ